MQLEDCLDWDAMVLIPTVTKTDSVLILQTYQTGKAYFNLFILAPSFIGSDEL